MKDIYTDLRNTMLKRMQNSASELRRFMGLSGQELSEYLGVTRQTVSNIEQKRTPMNIPLYLAYGALLDNYLGKHKQDMKAIQAVIRRNNPEIGEADMNLELNSVNGSFLQGWFACFPSNDDKRLSEVPEYECMQILARQYKVFLNHDTLQMLECREMLQRFTPVLQEFNSKIIVPQRSIEHLQNNLMSDETEVREAAKVGLDTCLNAKREGIISIHGEATDGELSVLYPAVFSRFKLEQRLLLISQDEMLRNSVEKLDDTDDIQGFQVRTGRLDDQGTLRILPSNWH